MRSTQIAARAYTLAEVDLMREMESAMAARRVGRSPDDRVIEERVRTNMMAGVDPEDLVVKNAAEKAEKEERLRRAAKYRQERINVLVAGGMSEMDARRATREGRHGIRHPSGMMEFVHD